MEPELIFGKAFYFTAMWIWRMRACYPWKEILLHDNTVGSCFRCIGHHPDCVSVMLFLWGIYFYCYAHLSFGGNYCPPNWEALAIARMQVAIYLWHQEDIIERAAAFLSPITFTDPPTPADVAAFIQTNLDEFVLSVFGADGKRLPPPMNMHINNGARFPFAQKWIELSTHERKFCGIHVDSRAMTLSMVLAKRDQFLEELSGWLVPTAFFSIGDITRLTGILGDHCRIC
jgi:hypothetical protein